MELVVLGGSGGWPRAGQGCSGYLIEHDGYRLLVDPGHGVLGELLRHCDPAAVDAVLISHGHLDHCADLVPLLRARMLGANGSGTETVPLPVLAPDGALDGLLSLDPVRPDGLELISAGSGDKIIFGPLTVLAQELRHQVVTFGYRIISDDGRVLAYTADSGRAVIGWIWPGTPACWSAVRAIPIRSRPRTPATFPMPSRSPDWRSRPMSTTVC
ncbi:hypothetical protein GCM10027613_34650 [Microlunatus endophyticus]